MATPTGTQQLFAHNTSARIGEALAARPRSDLRGERDGRYAGRYDAPPLGRDRFQSRRVRRYPAPTDRPGKAQMIQYPRVVVRHPSSQDLPFPGIGWCLESLHLLQNLQ